MDFASSLLSSSQPIFNTECGGIMFVRTRENVRILSGINSQSRELNGHRACVCVSAIRYVHAQLSHLYKEGLDTLCGI